MKNLLLIAFAVSVTSCIVINTTSRINYSGAFQDSTLSVITDSIKLTEGKQIYESKCKKCHALYNPKDYKLKVWKENLEEMRYKAELKNDEYEKILFYLKAYSRK